MNANAEVSQRATGDVDFSPSLHSSPLDHWFSYLFYEATYAVCLSSLTLGFSLRTAGRHNIPRSGPALVIANHQSFLDPVLIGLATRRHLCYLARQTLFRSRALAWLIRRLNGVPIDHEGVAKEGLKMIL